LSAPPAANCRHDETPPTKHDETPPTKMRMKRRSCLQRRWARARRRAATGTGMIVAPVPRADDPRAIMARPTLKDGRPFQHPRRATLLGMRCHLARSPLRPHSLLGHRGHFRAQAVCGAPRLGGWGALGWGALGWGAFDWGATRRGGDSKGLRSRAWLRARRPQQTGGRAHGGCRRRAIWLRSRSASHLQQVHCSIRLSRHPCS